MPKPIGPKTHVEVKKETFDKPKLRSKHIRDILSSESKPEKGKHSGGSSKSGSKGATSEKKKSKRPSQSSKKTPSGKGKLGCVFI